MLRRSEVSRQSPRKVSPIGAAMRGDVDKKWFLTTKARSTRRRKIDRVVMSILLRELRAATNIELDPQGKSRKSGIFRHAGAAAPVAGRIRGEALLPPHQ
jgi:hypothetical protein